jgi:hypothetical protein
VIIHFEGAICHAIDPPAIQRALAVNAYNSPHGSHTVSLRLKASDVNIAKARKVGKRSVIKTGEDLGILGSGKDLDTTRYFVYTNLIGVEIGVENPAEKLNNTTYRDEVHLSDVDRTFKLDKSCAYKNPKSGIVAAYVELRGDLTSCAAKHVGKFPGEAFHDFAAGTTMTVKTNGLPQLFIRDYKSDIKKVISTTVDRLEVTLSNVPAHNEPEPVGDECVDREHFKVFYKLSNKLTGPIPCETAVEPNDKTKVCLVPRSRYAGGVGCSNPGVP